MKNYLKYIYGLTSLIALSLSTATDASAQSYTEVKGKMTVYAATGATTLSNKLYIAPGAMINVIGEWRIASQQIYISPTATITGTGTIVFDRPSAYTVGSASLAWGAQTLDGGGAGISCNVEIRNPNGVSLANITPPAVFGYPSDTVADLLLNNQLIFTSAVIGNNLTANAAKVIFTPLGTIANYSPDHFIVTNSTGSVVRKLLGSNGFIFPVGIDSADYTPARLLNDGTPDDYSVRVLQGVSPVNSLAAGIGRTWDIHEAVAGGSNVTLTLQHNLVTSDPLYTDLSAYVSGSQAATATWDSSALTAGVSPALLTTGAPVANASTLSRAALTDFTTTTRFTKFSVVPFSLQAIKTASPDSVLLGDTFSYHIRVINTGIRPIAPPITIIDTLPSGANYISSSGAGLNIVRTGHIVNATYSDTLRRGDSIVLDIIVNAYSDTLGNIAYIDGGGNITPTKPCDTCHIGPTFPTIRIFNLRIPDAFSPNGDGVNDFFVIKDLSHYYPNASLSIYNRNGDEVWNSNGPYRDTFNGVNYNGDVLPVATYFYVLYYNDGTDRKVAHFLDLSR